MSARTPESTQTKSSMAVSRRSFVLGGLAGAASLFLTPLWQDGAMRAYAVDSANPEFKVFVVSNKEIGIAAVDVTNNQNRPLPGATVTLTTRGPFSTTKQGTTDADGNIVVDISKMTTPIDVGDGEVIYRFDGRIDIEKEGYRRVTIERIRCDGGSGMKVPTRLVTDQNYVYFRKMSFNGWDIQYTKNAFPLVKSELTTHDLAGEIEAPQKSAATVSLVAKDNGTGSESVIRTFDVTFSNGVGSFSASDHFLCPGHKACLSLNTSYLYHVAFSDGDEYRFETGLSVVQPPVDSVLSSGQDFALNAQDNEAWPAIKLGDSVPKPLQGTLTVWKPSFPIMGYVSPFGYAMFGVSTVGLDWVKNSPLTGGEWERESHSSAKQQWQELQKRWNDQIAKTQRMKSIARGAGKAVSFSSKLKASVALQAFLLVSCDLFDESKPFTGSANLLAEFSMGVELNWTFVVGPVPLFVTLSPEISALISAAAQVKAPRNNPLAINLVNDSNVQVSFTINIQVGVHVGVGISGVASFGFRGVGYFTIYIGAFEMKGYIEGYPLPRVIVSSGFDVEVIVQLLIFKWSGKLWSYSWPRLYDRWAGLNPTLTAGEVEGNRVAEPLGFQLGAGNDGGAVYSHSGPLGNGDLNLEAFLREASIVTEGELAKTAEVSAKQKAGFTATSFSYVRQEIGDDLYVAEMRTFGQANTDDAMEALDYEYIGHDEDTVCRFGDGLGVAGIGELGGVKPTADTRISRNIFSNPLQKTVLFHSTPYMFRIVSVTYKLQDKTVQRTRLSAQRYNADTGKWERPKVIDVNLGDMGARIDTFDHDFDVIAYSEDLSNPNVPNGMHVLLISGTRPSGDTTGLADVASNQLMTWLILDEYLQVTATYSWKYNPGTSKAAYSYPSVPRLVVLPASNGSSSSAYGIAAVYLRRCASTPEGLFGSAAQTTAKYLLLSGTKVLECAPFAVHSTAYDMVLAANTGSVSGGRAKLSFVVASRSSEAGVRITTVKMDLPENLAAMETNKVAGADMEFNAVENIADTKDITDVKVWPNHSALLTVKDGVLYASTFNPDVQHGQLSSRQVGPESIRMSGFMVSENGNVLLFLENREGEGGQTFNEAGEPSPTKVSIHRVCASILCDDLFSESFPLAELNHPVDSLFAVNGGASYTFLATSITDMSTSAADLYYLDIPVVATATPLGFEAVYQFVEQGDPDAPFFITLRNDGSVILKGCTIEMCDAETRRTVDSRRFSFSKDKLCASVWNPELYEDPTPELLELIELKQNIYPPECLAAVTNANDGPHLLADPAANNLLMPGKTAQYRVNFSIPKDWHGTKKVYFQLKDYQYDTIVSAVDTEGEVPVLHYTAPYHESLTSEVPVHEEVGDEEFDLFDPGAWKVEDDGSDTPIGGGGVGMDEPDAPGGSGGSSGSGGSGGSGSSGKTQASSGVLPGTGDASVPTVAGLAATAAAAGFLAYSARRHAIERAAEDSDGAAGGGDE